MMQPKITITSEENNNLNFTISNIPTCLANSLRRIILSDIPTVVFKTFPYSESKVNIITNTSRFNNEILKQRIGCIPIHITDSEFPIEEYSIELDINNDTDNTITVTTKDFKIKNITSDKYISDSAVRQIFPPDSITNDFIPICRLRPKFSDNIDGESLSLVANLSYSNAKEDGMYNVVSTGAFAATMDVVNANDKWNDIEKELTQKSLSKEEIDFEKSNWFLLDAKRITIPNSYDFIIESVGVFSNFAIVYKACAIMVDNCKNIMQLLEKLDNSPDSKIKIESSDNTTISNEFIVTLKDQDYTIGNAIVYFLYEDYFIKDKSLSFVGFRVPHPHIPNGVIRMAFNTPETNTTVIQYLTNSCQKIIEIFSNIQTNFK
uniref:DNA-directed RNA polymerase RpoA/D/Rpb3-type domain-containing protein n=1 Tax=viral metagenome TaxID=1070528 RepID=A0A6C0CK85_9ZZZZ